MHTHNTAIAIRHLSVSYEKHRVLKDVNVDIPCHAIVAIIGPNGSGKSTLLKTLLGLIMPERGSVSVFGQPPQNVRDRVAYVPQRFDFDMTTPITVNEFLMLSLPKNADTVYSDALTHFKIDALEHALLGTLSGGQLQRVLLARAFLQQPDILYLDEPGTGIDIGGEQDFYDLIEHLNRKHGMTIVFISHEIDIVSQRATHVLCLGHDNVCFGDTKTALQSDAFKTLYNTNIHILNHNHHA